MTRNDTNKACFLLMILQKGSDILSTALPLEGVSEAAAGTKGCGKLASCPQKVPGRTPSLELSSREREPCACPHVPGPLAGILTVAFVVAWRCPGACGGHWGAVDCGVGLHYLWTLEGWGNSSLWSRPTPAKPESPPPGPWCRCPGPGPSRRSHWVQDLHGHASPLPALPMPLWNCTSPAWDPTSPHTSDTGLS